MNYIWNNFSFKFSYFLKLIFRILGIWNCGCTNAASAMSSSCRPLLAIRTAKITSVPCIVSLSTRHFWKPRICARKCSRSVPKLLDSLGIESSDQLSHILIPLIQFLFFLLWNIFTFFLLNIYFYSESDIAIFTFILIEYLNCRFTFLNNFSLFNLKQLELFYTKYNLSILYSMIIDQHNFANGSRITLISSIKLIP